MGFAERWLVGTVTVLALVLLVSFLVPIELRESAVLHVYEYPIPLRGAPHNTLDRVRGQIARKQCRDYYDQAQHWYLVKKRYPKDLQAMEAPLRPGEKNLVKTIKDPWGNDYYIEVDGQQLRVWSSGPDAQEGTDDDISYPELD